MTGNVWEWTCDVFADAGRTARLRAARRRPRCPAAASRSHVIKGGSHLCAPNYCLRYRPAARQPEEIDTSTTHLGFRCIVRAG